VTSSKRWNRSQRFELDDYLHPSVLEVVLDDGLCAANSARIDIQWTTRDTTSSTTRTRKVESALGEAPTRRRLHPCFRVRTTTHHRMRVLVQTRSEASLYHTISKNCHPRSSNSGGSPTTRTHMHHSTQVATHRRNQSKCFPPRTPIEKRFLQVVGPGSFITIQDGNTQLKPWEGSRWWETIAEEQQSGPTSP